MLSYNLLIIYFVISYRSVDPANPRVAFAKNYLKMELIQNAKNEAELDAAVKFNPAVDMDNLSVYPELEALGLNSAPPKGDSTFTHDSTAWQNMNFGDYVATEAKRDETWPFIVGAVVVYVLLGLGIPAGLSEEGKKKSKYISYIEGRHGKLDDDHHH